MDFGFGSRGLQTGICYNTKIFKDSRNKCCKHTKRNYFGRSKRTSSQRLYRSCTCKSNYGRFLQYIFLGKKENGGHASSNKSSTSEQVSQETTFQNGYFEDGSKSGSDRRLGCDIRSERRLHAHSNIQKSQKISKVLYKRNMLSVQSSSIRAHSGASSLHKNSDGYRGLSSVTSCPTDSLFRRLAVDQSVNKQRDFRSGSHSQSPIISRFHNQCEEIESQPISEFHLSGGSVSPRSRHSGSNSRENFVFESNNSENSEQNLHSSGLFETVGNHGILHSVDTQCSVVHATNSETFNESLASNIQRMGCNSSIFSWPRGSFGMVVRFSKHFERQIFHVSDCISDSHDRCLSHCMGRAYWEPNSSGKMVNERNKSAYKLSGAGSCVSIGETFSSTTQGQKCSDSVRQHNSSSVHQQAGGNEIRGSVSKSLGSVAIDDSQSNTGKGGPYSRCEKHISGPTFTSSDKGDRMVPELQCTTSNISDLGVSVNRSVCLDSQPQVTSVLLMGSPSASICNRCSVNLVAEHVCVCLPANMPDTQSAISCSEVPMSTHSDSPTVVTTTVVSTNTRTSHRKSNSASQNRKSSVSTKNKNSSSKSRNAKSSCMAHIQQGFRAKGFSKQTQKLLIASWRAGTRKDYVAKFNQFHSWCREREIDPYTANLVQIADFLTGLYHKGLQYRTIAGYRSMLSSLAPPVDNKAVGQHPYIIRLLKGIFNSRPPVKRLVPEWDLSVVLEALQKAPFEPLKTVDLKYVTYKTVLLLAITSFRRCSDLQSLKIGEGSVNVTSQGITFIRHGLSKTDRPNHISPTVFIPAYTSNKKLDPRRTLKVYLERTHDLRLEEDGHLSDLFISYVRPYKPVTTQTISKWLVAVIECAYKEQKKSLDSKRLRAHSTRSVSSSWALFKGASMKSILEAGDWSRQSTFTRFYLKNVNTEVLKTS